MNKRINIVLPEATILAIDRMAAPGQRSRFIDQAVHHFVSHRSTEALRAQLERTAIRDRDLDVEISAEWQFVDKQAWQRFDTQEKPKRAIRKGAKSTSPRSTRALVERSKRPVPR
jgi:hypothetical protein